MAHTRDIIGRTGKSGRDVDIIDGRAVEKGTDIAIGFRPGDKTTQDKEGNFRPPRISAAEPSRFTQSPINPSTGFADKLAQAELQEFTGTSTQKPVPVPQPPKGGIIAGTLQWVQDKLWVGQTGFTYEQNVAISGVNNVDETTMQETLFLGSTVSTTAAFGAGNLALSPGAPRWIRNMYKTGDAVISNSKFTTGAKTAFKIIQNPKTVTLMGKILGQGPAIFSKGMWVAGGAIALTLWGMYTGGAEGTEGLSIVTKEALRNARKTNDYSLVEYAVEEADRINELTNPTKIINQIPGIGLGKNIAHRWEANQIAIKVLKQVIADAKALKTDEQIFLEQQQMIDEGHRIRQERELETARLTQEMWDRYDLVKADRQSEALRNQILAWEEYARRKAVLEEEERQKVADFWLEYWKQKLELQAETSRSQLGFGLVG